MHMKCCPIHRALSIALIAGLVFSTPAWAAEDNHQPEQGITNQESGLETEGGFIPELLDDQTLLSDEEIAAAFARGEVELPAVADQDALPAAERTASYRMATFSGSDRYATSALQVKTWTTVSSSTVVLANGEKFPDALTASSLAGALGCPILLIPSEGLSPHSQSALEYLRSIGVKKFIAIGGTHVFPDSTLDKVRALGFTSEARLSGNDRFATQLQIFEYGKQRNLWGNQLVMLASGVDDAFADALSASPLAYRMKAPIFLVDDSKTLNNDQTSALKSVARFTAAFAVGGAVRISDNALANLKEVSTSAERVSGADRYATSRALASKAIAYGWLARNNAAFATGSSPWDALGGGALQGRDNSVLILIGDGWTDAPATLAKGASSVRIFGGKHAVSSAVRLDLADKLGIAYRDIQGFKVYIDAGHGMNSNNNGLYDPGACSGNRQEASYTQEVANNVANVLRSYGIDVYVNTSGWYKLRHPQAVELGCDMLVSIHFNSGGGTGTESYVHSYNASWKSSDLRNRLHGAVVSAMGLRDRGKFSEALAVTGGKLPACLLEIGFIDNNNDMNRYNAQKSTLATSLANAIIR